MCVHTECSYGTEDSPDDQTVQITTPNQESITCKANEEGRTKSFGESGQSLICPDVSRVCVNRQCGKKKILLLDVTTQSVFPKKNKKGKIRFQSKATRERERGRMYIDIKSILLLFLFSLNFFRVFSSKKKLSFFFFL